MPNTHNVITLAGASAIGARKVAARPKRRREEAGSSVALRVILGLDDPAAGSVTVLGRAWREYQCRQGDPLGDAS